MPPFSEDASEEWCVLNAREDRRKAALTEKEKELKERLQKHESFVEIDDRSDEVDLAWKNGILRLMIVCAVIFVLSMVLKKEFELQMADKIKTLQGEMDAYYLAIEEKIDALNFSHESVKTEADDLSKEVADLKDLFESRIENLEETNEKMKNVFVD